MKRRDFLKVVGLLPFVGFVPKTQGLTLEMLYRCRDELEKAEKDEYSCSASASINPFFLPAAPSVKSEYPNKYDCEDWHNCTERDCFTCESLWVDSRRTLRTEVYVDHNFIVSFDRQLTDYEANAIMDENVGANVSFIEFGWRKY